MATCFGCKQPSSGQNRTESKYIEGMHSMGSRIVYNYWYIKSPMLADIEMEKF